MRNEAVKRLVSLKIQSELIVKLQWKKIMFLSMKIKNLGVGKIPTHRS